MRPFVLLVVVEFRRLHVVILFSSLKSVVKWNGLCVHQKKKKTSINISTVLVVLWKR